MKYCSTKCRRDNNKNNIAYRNSGKNSRKKKPMLYSLNSIKGRAKKRGLEFTLKLEDVIVPEYCPILGIKLEHSTGHGGKIHSPSIDRIDNARGYTPDNIQVISTLANQMKSSATPEQLLMFAEWVLKTYKEKELN
jgi:hypothetical protein